MNLHFPALRICEKSGCVCPREKWCAEPVSQQVRQGPRALTRGEGGQVLSSEAQCCCCFFFLRWGLVRWAGRSGSAGL